MCKIRRGYTETVLQDVVNSLDTLGKQSIYLQFTLTASPRRFGGVSSRGRLSMNCAIALHSEAERKFYRHRKCTVGAMTENTVAYINEKNLIL